MGFSFPGSSDVLVMTSSPHPTVSVVMSVYNGEQFLSEAIDSILAQSYRDFEFLIIDDGSTDETLEILTRYAALDSRIQIIRNSQNLMLVRSLNRGLALAKGKYIARQDADDISLPRRLERQVNYLEENPRVVAVSGRFHRLVGNRLHAGENILIHLGDPALMPWHMAFAYSAQHSIALCRAEYLVSYREDRLHGEDYDMWWCLMKHGPVVNLPTVIAHVRLHDKNITRVKHRAVEVTAWNCQRDIIAWIADYSVSEAESADLRAFGNQKFSLIQHPDALQNLLFQVQQNFVVHYPDWRSYSRRFITRYNLHWFLIALLRGHYNQMRVVFPRLFQWGLPTVMLGCFDLANRNCQNWMAKLRRIALERIVPSPDST